MQTFEVGEYPKTETVHFAKSCLHCEDPPCVPVCPTGYKRAEDGGSFNTREFFHGRAREVVRAVRWTFLALLFPVPAVLLIGFSGSETMLGAAFVVQYAGLLAERWYFFAEARHPQNPYYQAIA